MRTVDTVMLTQRAHLLSDTTVSPAKTAEHKGATCRIRLNDPCCSVIRAVATITAVELVIPSFVAQTPCDFDLLTLNGVYAAFITLKNIVKVSFHHKQTDADIHVHVTG